MQDVAHRQQEPDLWFFKITNASGGNFLGFKKFEKNQGNFKGPKEVEGVVSAENIKYSMFGNLKRVKIH